MSATPWVRHVLDRVRPSLQQTEPRSTHVADPDRALNYAERIHGVLPWLSRLSQETPLSENLDQRLRQERMRLALLDQELEAALEALLPKAIPVILLKGMELGRRYYPSRALRPMCDADLLVPEERFLEAIAALRSAGFEARGPLPAGRFRIELARGEHAPTVELHYRLQAGEDSRFLDGIWRRSQLGAIPGLDARVRALHPEDNLVYLLRHAGVQHLLESPIWLNDLHFLLKSPEFKTQTSWDRVLEGIIERKIVVASWWILSLLSRDWETPVPVETLRWLESRCGRLARAYFSNKRSAEKWFEDRSRSLVEVVVSRLLLRDSWREAFSYGIRRQLKRAW